MGSANSACSKQGSKKFEVITDKYKTYDELVSGLRQAGVEDMTILLAIDLSKSNTWTGEKTYHKSMHDFTEGDTPYMRIMRLIFPIVNTFASAKTNLGVYRFGDSETKDRKIAALDPLAVNGNPMVNGLENCIAAYQRALSTYSLSGPTTMAPFINECAAYARSTKTYVVAIILTDGDVSNPTADGQAVIAASKSAPLSIITVGVGDGDENGEFGALEEFDDRLTERRFDNFQFVNMNEMERHFIRSERPDLDFATNLFMEIPDQYKAIKQLGYLN